MSMLRKSLIVIPVLVFILACQAVARPVQQVQETAGTAAAFATQAGDLVTQVAPIQSAIPDVPGDVFNPQSPPLSEWKGIPVMPQAIAGQESDGMYVYKIAVSAQDVKDFYTAQLLSLGWEEAFSMPVQGSSIQVFTKQNQTLTVSVILTDGGDVIVMLTWQ